MAIKTNNASTFTSIAAVIVLFLIAAAALIYLQAGGGNTSATELAALSQAIPMQAARAVEGEEGAFDLLDGSVKRVASLPREDAPGRSAFQDGAADAHGAAARGRSRNGVAGARIGLTSHR